MRWLFGWSDISSLHSADELHQERNSCPLLRSCFIGSCHVGASKRFSRSISLVVHRHLLVADEYRLFLMDHSDIRQTLCGLCGLSILVGYILDIQRANCIICNATWLALPVSTGLPCRGRFVSLSEPSSLQCCRGTCLPVQKLTLHA